MNTFENYRIHDSKTGEVLISYIRLPSAEVEYFSDDNAEGHFSAASLIGIAPADQLQDVSNLGGRTVYAILL